MAECKCSCGETVKRGRTFVNKSTSYSGCSMAGHAK